jgi:hypothetical protein
VVISAAQMMSARSSPKFPSDDLEALPTNDDLDAGTARLTVHC